MLCCKLVFVKFYAFFSGKVAKLKVPVVKKKKTFSMSAYIIPTPCTGRCPCPLAKFLPATDNPQLAVRCQTGQDTQ